MRKEFTFATTVLSLMLIALFVPNNIAHGELPEYCSDVDGSITCEIVILPYSQPGSYAPEIAEIPVGASVIFRNTGPEIHTSTSIDASPNASPTDASSMVNGVFDTGILGIDGVSEPLVIWILQEYSTTIVQFIQI